MTRLKVTAGDITRELEVPDELLTEAEDFFARLDADMDRGWQMSRRWVDNPDTTQRCQILADRILTAWHNKNPQMAGLAAAYILKRLPGIRHVTIDITGDMTQTRFEHAADEQDA